MTNMSANKSPHYRLFHIFFTLPPGDSTQRQHTDTGQPASVAPADDHTGTLIPPNMVCLVANLCICMWCVIIKCVKMAISDLIKWTWTHFSGFVKNLCIYTPLGMFKLYCIWKIKSLKTYTASWQVYLHLYFQPRSFPNLILARQSYFSHEAF